MKQKVMKYLSQKNWLLRLYSVLFANRLVHYPTPLTPEYLEQRGWKGFNGDWYEPYVKDRDRITISFENHYYRVWHSEKRTFIALESSVEWFEMYFLLLHGDNGRYEKAGI